MGSASSTSAAPAAGEPDPDEGIEKLARMLAGGRSMTVFTGAGCSVEPPSSIPDFRSPGGLWSRYDPAVYCEYNTFVGQPHLFWKMATELTRDIHAINGGTQEELLETGKAHLTDQRYADAARSFGAALKLDPSDEVRRTNPCRQSILCSPLSPFASARRWSTARWNMP